MKRSILSVIVLAACGPNYRFAYEGEGAFERCYALDYDAAAPPEARQQCWSAWLQSYSFGAGVDRVEYARSRAAQGGGALGQAPVPVGAVASPAPPAAPASLAPPPPPLSPTAPPPATRAPVEADAWQRAQVSAGGNAVGAPEPTRQPAAPEAEPPGHACGRSCHDTWHACGGACAAGQTVCVARCDDAYRDCMRGCF
jgi:hypothetical protein